MAINHVGSWVDLGHSSKLAQVLKECFTYTSVYVKFRLKCTFASNIPPNTKRVEASNHLLYPEYDLSAAERVSSICDQAANWIEGILHSQTMRQLSIIRMINKKGKKSLTHLETKSSFNASKPAKAWRFPTLAVTIPTCHYLH